MTEPVEIRVVQLQSAVDYILTKLTDLRLDVRELREQINRLDNSLERKIDNLRDR